MMKSFKKMLIAVSFTLACLLMVNVAFAADYPSKNISGTIGWGAGGGTDNASRALTPVAENDLKAKIILQNKPGAAGSLAATTIMNSPADGYNILYNAEGMAIYKVLGLGQYDFHDFETICLMVFGIDVICVHPSTPYKTLKELIDAAKAKPKTIKLATTGTGGIPFVLASIFKAVNGAEFNNVGFDGDGTGLTALLGGHVDAMPISMMGSGTVDLIKTGKIRALAVISDKRAEQLPDVPAITEIYPEFSKNLPLGHYYGVFVKKGTPAPIVDTLRKSYMKAVNDPGFNEFIKRINGIKIALTGKEAEAFMAKNQSVVSWVLQDAGVAKVSPETLKIPRP